MNRERPLEGGEKGNTKRGPRWKRTPRTGGRAARTPLLQTREAEIPHLNWRFLARLHLASARPSIHPPLQPAFLVLHHGGNPQFWLVPTPPPPQIPSLPGREVEDNTPPSDAVLCKPTPTHRGSPRQRREDKNRRGCGIARQQTDRGGGVPISLSATCSLLGVAAATFRNPFGGFGPSQREVCGCAVSCSTSPHTLYTSYFASPLGQCVRATWNFLSRFSFSKFFFNPLCVSSLLGWGPILRPRRESFRGAEGEGG